MTSPTLDVAIFSYNRGAYLKNCVDSLQRNVPGVHFTVYDDGSDEPDTVAYLQSLGGQVRHMKSGGDERHGGYYNNMQAALDATQADYLLMLQDDLQVVRPFAQEELSRIHEVFEQSPTTVFISPLFMKGSKRAYFQQRYQADPALRCYRWSADPHETGKVPQKYADIALLHVARLRQSGWQFAGSEEANGALADRLFGDMVQVAEPWVFYVPEEPAYRGRVLTFGAKLAVKMAGNQVKSFRDMSAQASESFAQRDLGVYPFAEDFVDTVDPTVRKPYKFNAYRTRWLPLVLNKLELLGRRLWPR
jgi:glycosyltransferase involved in cell wall biosynthesis